MQVICSHSPTKVPYTDYTCTSCTKCLEPMYYTLPMIQAHEIGLMLTKVHTCTGGTQRIRTNTNALPWKFEHALNREFNKENSIRFHCTRFNQTIIWFINFW